MAKSYAEWSARKRELGGEPNYSEYQGYLNNIGATAPSPASSPAPAKQLSGRQAANVAMTERKAADDNPSSASFTTIHGSQGVTNPAFAQYAQKYPDLVANYNANWKDKGVSLAEYGAMHYAKYGRAEGRTIPGVSEGGGVGGGGMAREESGGGGGISISVPERPPIPLVYPMITPEYSAPMAQDFSAYMPADSIFGGQNGLLYQPWSQEYLQQYVPQGLINYTPPEINGMMPVYRQNPIGLLDVIAAAEELVAEEGGSDGDKKPKSSDDDLDMRGGKGPGDVGYGASNPAYGYANIGEFIADMSDRLAGGQGLTAGPGAGWGNAKAGAGIGVSGGTGKGPAAGGMGKGY